MTAPPPFRRPRTVVLAILDGWGHATTADISHNAILQAKTPQLDALAQRYPISFIDASELHVGLPDGQMGNSEVGHMNIGSGRVVMQDLPRIDAAIADGSLRRNPVLQEYIAKLKASGGTCHLMGLLSPGGVHSHQRHIAALACILAEAGVSVAIHAFLDGRDTPPQSAEAYVRECEAAIAPYREYAAIATLSGRYYAMDRDKRWDRVQRAYDAIVDAKSEQTRAATPLEALQRSYDAGVSDEFVLPVCIGTYAGMKAGDGVLMANFRADRAREILGALLDPDFSGFARTQPVALAATTGMVEYSAALNPFIATMFPPESLDHILGEVIAAAGLTQLRIAETEKYAHVTFFFNGGREEPFPGETRILIPSPNVATYDLKPEMSAPEVTDALERAILSGAYDLIVVNYANGDMVGHTGDVGAAIRAVEAVDGCIGRVWRAVETVDGAMMITADHGNAEMMYDPQTHQPHTAHTLNRVPFTLMGRGFETDHCTLRDGRLCDIAPTVLQLLGLRQPAEMTGHSLIAGLP